MVMRVGIRHAESDRNPIEKQRLCARLTGGAQIIARIKDKLIASDRKPGARQHRRIGAAVRIGHCLGDFRMSIAANPVENDPHPGGGLAKGGIQNMGCQFSGVHPTGSSTKI